MKYGFNLLLWATHVTTEHFPIVAKLKSAGYDGVEVPLFEGNAAHYQSVRKELDNLGLAATAVTVAGPENNPISPDAAVRQKGLDHIRWAVDMAAILGSEILCGPFHSPLAVFTGVGPTTDEKQRAADILRQAAEHAAKANVTLSIEYLNRFECYFLTTAADARALAQAVNHSHFRVMYDTFHAHIEEKHAGPAIRMLAPVLRHVHISENDRGTPGTGQVAWTETFQSLKDIGYNGWLTVESFGRALPALAAATKVWRDLFPPDEPWKKGIAFMRERWEAGQK